MKITNSLTTASAHPDFYARLHATPVGGTLTLPGLLPALDAPLLLTCTDMLLYLYTFTISYLGVQIGTAKILDDNGALAITVEEL